MNPLRLTRNQVRAVDRICIDHFGLPGIALMENAARGAALVAELLWHDLYPRDTDRNAALFCGGGNNGGDGYALARHLANAGWRLTIVQTHVPPRSHERQLVDSGAPAEGTFGASAKQCAPTDAEINAAVIDAMNLPVIDLTDADRLADAFDHDLLIDALFGTGLTRPIEGPVANLIDAMNETKLPILALDLPSGLDADTGSPTGPCVQATRTVTFVAEKIGFANPAARRYIGDIVVADIGAPRAAIERVVREVER